jgi:hypothetical protein
MKSLSIYSSSDPCPHFVQRIRPIYYDSCFPGQRIDNCARILSNYLTTVAESREFYFYTDYFKSNLMLRSHLIRRLSILYTERKKRENETQFKQNTWNYDPEEHIIQINLDFEITSLITTTTKKRRRRRRKALWIL